MAGKRAPTLGSVVDQMTVLRNERRALEAKDKELKEQFDALEQELIQLLDAQGLDKCSGQGVSASITESEQFSFDGENGFELFMPWMAKHKYWHLVQRRVSAPAMREVFAAKGGKIPGVAVFQQRKISLRDLK